MQIIYICIINNAYLSLDMPSIRIRHIGPLIDTGLVEMKTITLFIGAQSTGKSTLMKILCFCRWVEKRIMVSEEKETLYNYTHYHRFLRELKQFHRFNDDFFTDESEIDYHGDTLNIYLKGKSNARIITQHDFNVKRCNAKICFIPSERNFLSAIHNADRAYRSNNIDLLFNYIFEWAETRGMFTSEHPKVLSFDENIEYYYDANREMDTLRLRQNGETKEFEPFYASSGVQSALPLEVMVDYVTSQIGKSVDVSQKWLMDFIRDYIMNKQDPGKIAIKPQEDPLLSHILVYQYANLFIEEPEQNLFPKSQWSLLCHMVSTIRSVASIEHHYTNSIVLTTHSPYILSALNILTKVDEAMRLDEERTLAILPKNVALPISDVSAYHIADGRLENLIDDEVGMINGNALDSLSDDLEDYICQLNDIIYG